MSSKKDNVKLLDYGPVKEMVLPEGWVEMDMRKKSAGSIKTIRKFHKQGDDKIQICVHYRGLPVTEDSSRIFLEYLDSEPCKLSDSEFLSLQEILGSLALIDEFQKDYAKIDELCGKKVLEVEGTWTHLSVRSRNVYIDARDDGSIVYDLYYAAPKKDFDSHIKDAIQTFASIEWQKV